MSDTPRTDAACGWPWGQHGRIESSDLKCSPDGPFVHSSVARELERENAELREVKDAYFKHNNVLVELMTKEQKDKALEILVSRRKEAQP